MAIKYSTISERDAAKVAEIVSGTTGKQMREFRKSLGINVGEHVVLSETQRAMCPGYIDYQRVMQTMRGDIVRGEEKNSNLTNMQKYAMLKIKDTIISQHEQISALNKENESLKNKISCLEKSVLKLAAK